MIPICTEIENLIHPVQLREDEYINESGLICCSKCRTPRQKRIEVSGKTIEPRCMCACQTEDYDRREQERKHREFLDLVAKNRSIGLPDPGLRKHTFENDLGTTRSRSAWQGGMFSTGKKCKRIPPDCSCGVMWAPARALSQAASQMPCWIRVIR